MRISRALRIFASATVAAVGVGAGVVPATAQDTMPLKNVQAGARHACADNEALELYCWGDDSRGQLGNGAGNGSANRPHRVRLPGEVSSVALGADFSCATVGFGYDAELYCWGANDVGQLGLGWVSDREETPQRVAGLPPSVKLASAGGAHACASVWRQRFAIYCWGDNRFGQVGKGTTSTYEASPTHVEGFESSDGAQLGQDSTCLTDVFGKAWCWGRNDRGQLGDGTRTHRSVPTLVAGLDDVIGVASRGSHACAITSKAQRLKCWGDNTFGQLGNGGSGLSTRPVTVLDMPKFPISVTLGQRHTCALNDYIRQLRCWGDNRSGQLGDGTLTVRRTPVIVQRLATMLDVSLGNQFTCARNLHNVLKCWGANNNGQLGNGTNIPRRWPTSVATPIG